MGPLWPTVRFAVRTTRRSWLCNAGATAGTTIAPGAIGHSARPMRRCGTTPSSGGNAKDFSARRHEDRVFLSGDKASLRWVCISDAPSTIQLVTEVKALSEYVLSDHMLANAACQMGGPRRRPLGASVAPLFGHLCLYSPSSTAVIVSLYVSSRRAIVSASSSLNRMDILVHCQLLPWGQCLRPPDSNSAPPSRSAKYQEVAGHFTLRVVSGTFAGPCVDLFAENNGMFSSVALGAHEGRLKDVRVACTRDLEPRAGLPWLCYVMPSAEVPLRGTPTISGESSLRASVKAPLPPLLRLGPGSRRPKVCFCRLVRIHLLMTVLQVLDDMR